eukprot:8366741-Alexandrium_andersonii.AAC.1
MALFAVEAVAVPTHPFRKLAAKTKSVLAPGVSVHANVGLAALTWGAALPSLSWEIMVRRAKRLRI